MIQIQLRPEVELQLASEAQARGVALSGEDYFRVRPPLTPITVAALAGLASKPAAGG